MTPPPLRTLLEDLDAQAHEPLARQLAFIEQARPAVMAQRDPLLKARFVLRAAQVRDTSRPLSIAIDDLLGALRVFHANDNPGEHAQCLAALAHWYYLAGLEGATQLAGRSAMSTPDLPLNARLSLLRPLCLTLAAQLRLPEAWALLGDMATPARVSAASEEARLRIDALCCMLHVIEAIRARRLPSLYALDVSGEPPKDDAIARRHLKAAAALLPPVRAVGFGAASAVVRVQFVHAGSLCAALLGQPEAVREHIECGTQLVDDGFTRAVMLLDHGLCQRLLGHPGEARALQRRALVPLRRLGLTRPLLLTLYELSLAESALDHPAAAHRALTEHLQVRARLQASDAEAMATLHLASQRAGASCALAAPVAAPPDAALRRSEPPCLARAERLLLQHLPRRLGPAMLAEQTGVSLRTLQHAARHYRGMTLTEMKRGLLMREALRLLSDTDLSLREIAARCGYRDDPTFSRDFKRVHGSAPGQHRDALRQAPAAHPALPAQADPPGAPALSPAALDKHHTATPHALQD